MKVRTVLLSFLAAAFALNGVADIRLGSPFADGAVLQRERQVPVWGLATAGAEVTVSFAGQTAKAVAGADGRWRADLSPLAASATGRELTVTAGEEKTVVRDVLVGEVWFCSGQSNCELPIWGPRCRFRDKDGYQLAEMTDEPLVRYAYCSDYQRSKTPLEFASRPVAWRPFNRENLLVCDSERQWGFSAMGVYFALELHRRLRVPVGIVGAYWGGTAIQSWFADSGDLFNQMVAPWCPYALKGLIWYQGCSNAQGFANYCGFLHRFYDGWTKAFENPELALRFVQIAPWGGYRNHGDVNDLVGLQEAQAQFAAEEPRAGMVVINDAGNLHDIHPNEKAVVGRRLAALALKRDYGFDLQAESPVPVSWTVEGAKVRIRFDHVKEWTLYTWDQSVPTLFQMAGEDGIYHSAQIDNLLMRKNVGGSYFDGEIVGQDLVISAAGVDTPRYIRYLYSKPYFGHLVNEANLPLGVFHLDLH